MTSRRKILWLLSVSTSCVFVTALRSADNPKVSIDARAKRTTPEAKGPRADIRVDTNVVRIPVTVTDPINRFVTGLEKENFKIFEGKVQ